MQHRHFYSLKRTFLLLILVSYFGVLQAQTNLSSHKNDSLWAVWSDASLPNSTRLKAFDDFIWNKHLYSHPDSAIYFAKMQYDFAEQKNLKKEMAGALNTQGVAFYLKSEYNKALELNEKSLSIREEIGDKTGVAKSLNNIGAIHKNRGDYTKALDCYKKSLKIFEELNDQKGIAGSLNNIGLIYEARGDYMQAINFQTRSLKLKEKIGDKHGTSSSLNNIGAILHAQGEFDKAIENYQTSLKIREEVGDKPGIAGSLNNIGTIYQDKFDFENANLYYAQSLAYFEELDDKEGISRVYNNIGSVYKDKGTIIMESCNCQNDEGNFSKALNFFSKSLKIRNEIGDKQGQARVLNGFADIYLLQKKYVLAISHYKLAMEIALKEGMATEKRDAAFGLYKAYKQTHQPGESLKMHELFMVTRDSIESAENQKEVIRQEFKYKYEKQATADSIYFAKENEIKKVQIEKQQAEIKVRRNLQYTLFGGLLITLIFAGFIFNRFKITSRQKGIIENQKEEVEAKNKLVTESIEYASRLQTAMLPPLKLISNYLPQSFVLYKPRDIVAGDFYWTHKMGDTIFFAAADCTGHGVPAAMVSVVCCNALNRVVGELKITEPGHILTKTRELVLETFIKSEQQVYEGMDISLGALKGMSLNWSGANNPLWLIRNGEIKTLIPDRQPVGKSDNQEPFNSHQVDLQQGDMLYVFTDGFADQFGGPQHKKFKSANFKKLLLELHQMDVLIQKEKLESAFEHWRGKHEQLDDVCVIGIRV